MEADGVKAAGLDLHLEDKEELSLGRERGPAAAPPFFCKRCF
jgi:hypothetical protein